MRYLLDTHVLIWHAENQNLSQSALDIIGNPKNTMLVSHASLWEMTIKMSIGKLKFNYSIADFQKLLIENQFEILPFDFECYEKLSQLPFHHQDPFDRMLIAQALVEGIPILTHDHKFDLYDVKIVAVV